MLQPVQFGNIDYLDSFRGLAAISVVVSHAGDYFAVFDIIHGYYFGVIMFFILSAFLLTFRLVSQYDSAGLNIKLILMTTINYMITRIFRIFVPFIAFCLMYICLEKTLFGDKDHGRFFLDVLLLNRNSTRIAASRYGHLWTIPIEV